MGGGGSTGLIECENKKSILKSFTLAEVLITLTIIGFVAAMTVPILTANHKKIEYAAKLKKFYNTMNSAIEQAEIDYDLPRSKWPSEGYQVFFDNYLKDYIKYTKIDTASNYPNSNMDDYNALDWSNFSVYLDDGMILNLTGGSSVPIFLVDVNGEKGPNKDGHDIFDFEYQPNPQEYCQNLQKTRAQLISDCSQSVGHAAKCTCLVMLDGWEFKKDYPLKL